VLLDARESGAEDRLIELREQVDARPLLVTGHLPLGEAFAGADDVLDVDALERELPLRLSLAEARGEQRREIGVRRENLTLLLEVAAEYAERGDVQVLLHGVTRRLADALGITRASLVLVDGEQGVVVAASDDAALREHRILLSAYPEVTEALRTAQPVVLTDAADHPLLEGVAEKVRATGIRSIASLPLIVRGRGLGVMLLRAGRERTGFQAEEIDFLQTLAHVTALSISSARLLERLRGDSERERNARIAAEERAEQLARYEGYFAHLKEGVAIVDAESKVLSLNPSGASLLGVSATEARELHVVELLRPLHEEHLLELLSGVAAGEARAEDVDLRIRTLCGRGLILSLAAGQLHEEGEMAILSFRDVTTQRTLADELRKTKDFLERLIDSSADAIIAADMKGRVILFNKGAEDISGYTAREALSGLRVEDIYPPGVAREIMRRLRSGEDGGVGRLNLTRQELRNREGELIPVNLTASILYEGGRELATVGIFTDLRARVQLEERLTAAQVKLQASEKNAVLVALAGTAAHELNQPLTSVMGYAELLKRKLTEGDPAFRSVDIIYREAERMAEIVRKIGRITRFETKAYVGSAQIVDLDKASSNDE